MSEYQHYEFQAIDRSLSDKEMSELRSFATRAEITPNSFVNEGNLQKQGYGTKLLDAAEREAIRNGCIFSLVDTWDFQKEAPIC